MGQLLAYSLTSSILLACLYLVYKWVLSSENYHKVNRLVIWSIYLAALGLPSFWKAIHGIFAATSAPAAVTIDVEAIAVVGVVVDEPSSSAIWLQAAICLYVAGMVVVSALTLANFGRLYGIIRRGEKIRIDGKTVVLTGDDGIAPFSFCNTIVVPRKDFSQYGPMIMLHEKSHVEFHHWIDLLFAQGVCILQWFNPAAWLMREEMKAIHEYQADDRVITAGVNVKEYQMLLIKKAVGARFPSLANSLNHSKLKKRITMMYNQKTSRRRALRPLLLLPALGAAFWISQLPAVASALSAVSSTELSTEVSAGKVSENTPDRQIAVAPLPVAEAKVSKISAPTSVGASASVEPSQDANVKSESPATSTVVEQMPEYPGGMRAMMDFIIANIERPEGTDDINGRVVLKFVVEKDGSIGDVQVLKSLDPRLDAEAIRVVKSFPKWIPGKTDGKNVAVWYALPVSFRSMGDDAAAAKPAAGGSSSTSVSTSVTTSTDDSGNTSISTVRVIGYTEDGNEPVYVISSTSGLPDNTVYYVNGERYDGDLKSIPPADIESMSIDKSDKNATAIRIELKKK